MKLSYQPNQDKNVHVTEESLNEKSFWPLPKNFVFQDVHRDVAQEKLDDLSKVLPKVLKRNSKPKNDFDSLRFVDKQGKEHNSPVIEIVSADLIFSPLEDNKQKIRFNNFNPILDKLLSDLSNNGYRPNSIPIFVKKVTKKGKTSYEIVDGVTRNRCYSIIGVKNRLVVIVEINEDEELTLGNRLNAGESLNTIAGIVSENDLSKLITTSLNNDYLQHGNFTVKDIRNEIEKALGDSPHFGFKKRESMAQKFYTQWLKKEAMEALGYDLNVFGQEAEARDWLERNNYVNTDKVHYVLYNTASITKSLVGLAGIQEKNPGKELRLVVYLNKYDDTHVERKWANNIQKFYDEFNRKLSEVVRFYSDGNVKIGKHTLFGVLPANIPDLCEDNGKVLSFSKVEKNIKEFYQNLLTESLDDEDDE